MMIQLVLTLPSRAMWCRRLFIHFKLYTCVRLGLVVLTLQIFLFLLKHKFNNPHQVYSAHNRTQNYVGFITEPSLGQWQNVSGSME